MPVFLLPFLGLLKSGAGALWIWLCHRSFWQLVCIGLLALSMVQFIGNRAEKRHSAKVEAQLVKCGQARHADREAYRKAQAEAQAKNDAQVVAAVAKQENINHAQVSNLNARLELIRSELRHSAPQRPAGRAKAGPGVESACRAADPAWLCLSPEERLRAAENEERHDELIDLVIQQSAVNPN